MCSKIFSSFFRRMYYFFCSSYIISRRFLTICPLEAILRIYPTATITAETAIPRSAIMVLSVAVDMYP